MKVIYEPKGRANEYSKLAVNLYNGCSHACKYCYAPNVLRKDREVFNNEQSIRNNILTLIEQDLKELNKKGIKERVLFCFTSDPYQNDDDFNMTTRYALELFRKYDIPFQILTKGGIKAIRDFDLYTKQDAFATTLTFYNEELSKQIEPNATRPSSRIEAIKEAKKMNIETWVSFEPVINEWEVYKLLAATQEYVDFYKVGKCSGYKSNVENWERFAYNIINELERLNKKYYIKEDLKKCLVQKEAI